MTSGEWWGRLRLPPDQQDRDSGQADDAAAEQEDGEEEDRVSHLPLPRRNALHRTTAMQAIAQPTISV